MENTFQGKRIAILGLSIEGIATLKFLYKKGASITVCDQREEEEFTQDLISELKTKKISLRLGCHYLDSLDSFEMVVRTPGLPLWEKKLQEAVCRGVILTSHTKIFFNLCQGKIIGVTGTKGKGTTSALIYELLKASGEDVFLGGNIGTPPLSFIDKVKKNSWVVLELSSFQLEDLNKSPHIAVVLNITSDHLYSSSKISPNYHLSHKDYLQAKINVLRFQNKKDFAVLNKDYKTTDKLRKYTQGEIWFFSKEKEIDRGFYIKDKKIYLSTGKERYFICDTSCIQLRGVHNLENITAAATAAFIAGTKISLIPKVISSFKGLEHRLEFVKEVNGIKFYNDSFSTTPETAIAAIRSFTEPIILICGGSEKGSDYQKLGQEIVKGNVKKVILIGQTASKIKQAIIKASLFLKKPHPYLVKGSKKMDEIVKLAFLSAQKGDIILLSPACASFDMFKNYKERGLLFKKAVNLL